MGRRSFDHVSQGHDMLVDSTRKCLAANEAFMKDYQDGVGLVKPCIVLVGMGRCSDTLYRKSKEMADNYGTVLHMHQANMLENIQEAMALHGERPVEHLYNIGALGSNVVMVHMVHVNQKEIGMLAKSKANVVHCPNTATGWLRLVVLLKCRKRGLTLPSGPMLQIVQTLTIWFV